MAKRGARSLTVTIHAEGVRETLAAFRSLPKDANAELRKASKEIVKALVPKIKGAAYAAPTPQASKVAPRVRHASDRVPAIAVTDPVRGSGIRGHGVLFGSEFGSDQFGQFHHRHTGKQGIWFFASIEANQAEVIRRWRHAADQIVKHFGRVS